MNERTFFITLFIALELIALACWISGVVFAVKGESSLGFGMVMAGWASHLFSYVVKKYIK